MDVNVWWVDLKSSIMIKNTDVKHTHTHTTTQYLQARLKRAQGGFVSLWKGPRKMFSDKLFTIPQSLLGRVLHHTVWHITPSLSPSLFAPDSASLFPSLTHTITHSLFSSGLALSLFLSLSLSPSLSCYLVLSSLTFTFLYSTAQSHAPREEPSSWASCRW